MLTNDLINTYDYLGLAVKESECKSIASRATSNPGSISRELRGIVEDMDKRKCAFLPVSCQCCAPRVLGGFYPASNEIKLCYNNIADATDLIETVQHEMTHALQECKSKSTNTCEAVVCEEIQAYLNDGGCQRAVREGRKKSVRECVINGAANSAANFCGDKATAEAEARKSYEKCNKTTPAPR